MKKFLIILLLPLIVFTQDSWLTIEFNFDNYSDEVTWNLYDSTNDTVASGGDYNNLNNATEFLDSLYSGDYTFELLDEWGDGLSWPLNGSCVVSNSCQDTLFFAQGNYGFGLIESLTLAPCAPPVIGCMDENALNYDSTATTSDESMCEYPSCEGLGNTFVDQICVGSQALLYYNWEASSNPNCNVIQIIYGSNSYTNAYTFDVNIDSGLWGVYAGNGQMPPNWEEEFSFQVMHADSTLSDTLLHTPYPCTQGCTDSEANNYNPWANVDDESCGNQACDSGYTPITIEVSLDNWPSETGWSFVSGDGSMEIPSGSYSYQDVGQTFTYNVCAMEGGFEFIITDTYGDGLGGSTTGGTTDGDIVIKGCDGEVITKLSDGNWINGNQELTGVGFGSVAYSIWQQSTICAGPEDVLGCTDPEYQEFNLDANIDDGSCTIEHVYGCVDSGAFNYDSEATQMEIYPNCDYTLTLEDDAGDGWGNSFLGVTQGDNTWSFTMGPGEYEQSFPIWLETDKLVTFYYFAVGGVQTPPEEVAFQTLHNSFTLTNANGAVLLEEGTNPFADNGQGALQPFEAPLFITYKDLPFCGTLCVSTVEGCMDSEALNYNEEANTDNGDCIEIIEGCTNELAFNYYEEANVDNGTCEAVVIGCMDSEAYNYNSNANTDGGGCVYLGCTDNLACNYDSIANADSGGCIYPNDYYDCNGVCVNDIDDDGVCDELEIEGCTILSSINYNPEATNNDGSCVPFIYGCMDPTAFNYNPDANTDNDSCIVVINGCTDITAYNYNSGANTLDNSCCYITGCTDSVALNFNINACYDDGSCVTIVEGCTDVGAFNYDPLANVPDLSMCLYDAGCYGGPGEPYWLNDPCYAWVIDVDSYCCDESWDTTCQSMYNYCGEGWPISIDESSNFRTITVYPNPSKNIFNIDTRLDIEIEIYNINGKRIIKTNEKRISLSGYPNGIYNMIIVYDKMIFNKVIIKQS